MSTGVWPPIAAVALATGCATIAGIDQPSPRPGDDGGGSDATGVADDGSADAADGHASGADAGESGASDASSDATSGDACVDYMHNDGFGVNFPDCTMCGYNSATLALGACQLYAATHNITTACMPIGCGGYGLSVTATACYTWVYQGGMAGYIVLAFSNGCSCVNGGGGVMTYGQCAAGDL